ncbi:MAG: RsmE family RNA methyltransferase [Candidatus Paceibacterota bacterium]|jgi:16S rRNA (uracil1498-N3)-methyltransferase
MKVHRFFIDKDLSEYNLNLSDSKIINQIKNVLRLKIGEEVSFFNGRDEVLAKINSLEKDKILFSCKKISIKKDRGIIVSLYCSVVKKDKFEWIVEKASEVGIFKIIPVISSRTIKTSLNLKRLNDISKEASEQSGRITLPLISDIMTFSQSIEDAKFNKMNVFLNTDIDDRKIPKIGDGESIGIFVGPEGGWTQEESDLAKKNGFLEKSLGNNIFRTETAAIVASYLFANS